jgi:hypothetical protein
VSTTRAGAGQGAGRRGWDALDQFREGYALLAALEEGGLDTTTANRNAGLGVALDLLRAVDYVRGARGEGGGGVCGSS